MFKRKYLYYLLIILALLIILPIGFSMIFGYLEHNSLRLELSDAEEDFKEKLSKNCNCDADMAHELLSEQDSSHNRNFYISLTFNKGTEYTNYTSANDLCLKDTNYLHQYSKTIIKDFVKIMSHRANYSHIIFFYDTYNHVKSGDVDLISRDCQQSFTFPIDSLLQ